MKCEKMAKCFNCCDKIYQCKLNFIDTVISPLFLLALRMFIALIFLKSGLTKIDNFEATLYLFQYEYAVPFVSPEFAAYSATFFEIACSILIILGFATRIAALPLIVMTLAIQFFVIQNPEHYYWLFLLSTLVIFGAGKLSFDKLIRCAFANCSTVKTVESKTVPASKQAAKPVKKVSPAKKIPVKKPANSNKKKK